MKTIFLLVGKKGSGKSFIGNLFQTQFNVPFIRVEDWAKKVKRDRDVFDDFYVSEVFQTIEAGIRSEMVSKSSLVFESTGLTDHFDKMMKNLKSDFKVVIIAVHCETDICLQRVKTRDQSIHINVSDDEVNRINEAVTTKHVGFDFLIENHETGSDEIIMIIKNILDNIKGL